MFHRKSNAGKSILTAALLATMVLAASGCSNGYYPGAGYSYGGSPATMRSSSGPPPGYYYSDPGFCKDSPVCLVIIGALVGGAALALGSN